MSSRTGIIIPNGINASPFITRTSTGMVVLLFTIGFLIGSRFSAPSLNDCILYYPQNMHTNIIGSLNTNNNALYNTIGTQSKTSQTDSSSTSSSKSKKSKKSSKTNTNTPDVSSSTTGSTTTSTGPRCPDCICPDIPQCPDVICPDIVCPDTPASECPSSTTTTSTSSSSTKDPLGLTYWRQMAYSMAPFVFPQLYKCTRNPNEVTNGPEYRSQSNEDRWLWEKYFSTLPQEENWGGTFIEIGALDGQTFSNTWFFEKTRDWRGLLIEGHPVNSVTLRNNQNVRSNTAIFTMAACGLNGNGGLGTLGFTNNGGAIGSAVEEANEKFLRGWHGGQTTGTFPIDCAPLQALLDVTGTLDVDFFSLDVEGAEYLVLQTIDWDVTNIRVILVELDGGDPGKDDMVRTFLRNKGFISAPWGAPRDACTPGRDCTSNDAFLNPNYMDRKRNRVATSAENVSPISPFHPPYGNSKYRYGSGQKC